MRVFNRPLATGLRYGQVSNRRRAFMVRIHAAYTLCPPTSTSFRDYLELPYDLELADLCVLEEKAKHGSLLVDFQTACAFFTRPTVPKRVLACKADPAASIYIYKVFGRRWDCPICPFCKV